MDELDKITSKLKQRLVFPPDSSYETPRLQTTTTSTGTRTTELNSTFTHSTTGDVRQLMTDNLQTDPKEVFTHIQVNIRFPVNAQLGLKLRIKCRENIAQDIK